MLLQGGHRKYKHLYLSAISKETTKSTSMHLEAIVHGED